MKVIFLDIDGVLNSVASAIYHNHRYLLGLGEQTCDSLCPIATSNLRFVLKELSDVKIVISSTWRKLYSLEELKEIFRVNGLFPDSILGVTPSVSGGYRGTEIDLYLKGHPEITSFVIIDDDSDMDPYMDRLVNTDCKNGLTFSDAEKVIEMLGGKIE